MTLKQLRTELETLKLKYNLKSIGLLVSDETDNPDDLWLELNTGGTKPTIGIRKGEVEENQTLEEFFGGIQNHITNSKDDFPELNTKYLSFRNDEQKIRTNHCWVGGADYDDDLLNNVYFKFTILGGQLIFDRVDLQHVSYIKNINIQPFINRMIENIKADKDGMVFISDGEILNEVNDFCDTVNVTLLSV